MDYDVIVFWLVCFSCLTGLVMTLVRLRSAGRGWAVLFLLILVVALAGWLREANTFIYASGLMWLVLVLLPGLLGTVYHRRFLQQRYPAARRLARIISWLHPADGWRQQPEIVRALELAQKGELADASETLKRYQGVSSQLGLVAMTNFYRITNQWEEMLAWEAQHRLEIGRVPQLMPALLRARGETGDLRGLAEMFARNNKQIARLAPPSSRDLCRLMLFAFCGRRDLVERLFASSLALFPASTQEFWLATADLAAGKRDAANQQLELLLPTADPSLRLAIERRRVQGAAPAAQLGASAHRVIESATLEQDHDASFGAQPTLFSSRARVTQTLIVLNVLMFGAEVSLGGGANLETLYRLGALYPPAVRAGEWSRLVASLFLHAGVLHLAMNMFALCVLGPFVEFALGSRRFLLVYLLAGIGSMAVVTALASGPGGEQMTVGASGAVMGLIGGTGALMLRGWLQQKAVSARRRLLGIITIVVLQTFFDALVPQVSMTGHLAGAAIGFAAAAMLRHRLGRLTAGGAVAPNQRGTESAQT